MPVKRQRQVLAWIRAAKRPQISREDVRRYALGQALNARQSMNVIEALECAGCLRRVDVPAGAGGGPRPLRWDVNPALIGESLAPTALTPAELLSPDRGRGRERGLQEMQQPSKPPLLASPPSGGEELKGSDAAAR
jgi:hypothetical protein